MSDGSLEQIDKAKAALEPTATPYFEQHKQDDDSVAFVYFDPCADKLMKCFVRCLGLPETRPLLILVKYSESCHYICKAKELNEAAVKEFFDSYLTGALEPVARH